MSQSSESESGYLTAIEDDCSRVSEMCDVEILYVSGTNVIARGRRYGRLWFLKGLREELRDSAAMQRQLQKEFELHSRLRHPLVVQLVGLETIDGLGLCMVQEWVDGSNLAEELRKGNISKKEAHRILYQLVETVGYLHRNGVVHRDLKPSNVMIRSIGGEVVLIDFGLADSDDYVESKQPAGTLGYVSPEQAERGGADPSDDVYSLGVMMRELTPDFKRLARRCTAPPARRPKDADALLKLLQRRKRRPKIVGSVLLCLAVLAVAIFFFNKIDTLRESSRISEHRLLELSDKNIRNEALVTSLRDSLHDVRSHLNETEQKLKKVSEYDAMRRKIYRDGCEKIDRMLSEADRKQFSKLAPGNIYEYSEKIIKFTQEMSDEVEKLSASAASSSLSAEDKEKMRMDFYNYNAIKLAKYQHKWLKNINAVR